MALTSINLTIRFLLESELPKNYYFPVAAQVCPEKIGEKGKSSRCDASGVVLRSHVRPEKVRESSESVYGRFPSLCPSAEGS